MSEPRMTILDKCLRDPYVYYTFIKNIGWVEFFIAEKISKTKILLKDFSFLDRQANSIIASTRYDMETGLEVRIKDMILLLEGSPQ